MRGPPTTGIRPTVKLLNQIGAAIPIGLSLSRASANLHHGALLGDSLTEHHAAARKLGSQVLIRPQSYPFFDKLLFIVLVLGVPPFVGSHWSVFRDGDVSWHIAAGRWIMEHGRVPALDPFSFTMSGKPWVAFEWGSEIIYASAFNLAGFAGLAAVVTAALMALFAAMFWHLRSRVGPIGILVAFALAYVNLQPFILARPHLLAWPFLALWTGLILKYRDEKKTPPLWLALIMFVWSNLHGSYFAGFVVAAALSLDAVIEANWDRKIIGRWFLFGILILLATLFNANGLDGFLHPISVSSMETLPEIGEWKPSTIAITPIFFLTVLIASGAVLLRRPKFGLGEVGLLLLTLAMALTHLRHQSIFVIIATMIVTPKLAGVTRGDAPPMFTGAKDRRLWVGAALVASVTIMAARMALPFPPGDSAFYPRTLIAHVPAELQSKPVFNEYSMGGPLILHGMKVYIDGRADMYGDAYVRDYLKIIEGDLPLFNKVAGNYGICWTMVRHMDGLGRALDRAPGWRRLFQDKIGVIHVREDCLRGNRQAGRLTNSSPMGALL